MSSSQPRIALPDPGDAAHDDHGGLTRAGAFRLLAGSAAGAAGVALLAAPGASAASHPRTPTDVTILQYALTLEYLGAAFYESALQNARLSGEAHDVAHTFRWHERAHVTFVSTAIRAMGATPHRPERFAFGSATRSRAAFLRTSAKIEEMCVETLNGAGPLVSKPVLAASGTLVTVEARQAAWVRDILHQPPAPVAFTPPLTAQQSMDRLRGLGFVKD